MVGLSCWRQTVVDLEMCQVYSGPGEVPMNDRYVAYLKTIPAICRAC